MADQSTQSLEKLNENTAKLVKLMESQQKSTPVSLDLTSFNNAVKSAGSTLIDLAKGVTDNISVWRKLSGVGANFSNDVVGMSIAAAEARVSLSDFAELISLNAKNFAGLGGSVSRGTEIFAKMTKEFQDTSFSKELMNIGFTASEVNDTLALYVGFQKSAMRMDNEGKQAAFTSATALAKEMDLIAKLTGKSRQEQARQLQEAQRNGSVEAAIRQEAQGDAIKEAQLREQFQKQFIEFEKIGMGDLFIDMFTKGFPATEEAAAKAAMMGKSFTELQAAVQALKESDYEAANAATKRSTVENAMLQNDPTFLMQARLGEVGGATGRAAKLGIEANDALHHSIKEFKKSTDDLGTSQQSYAKAIDGITNQLKQSQAGYDAAGKYVGGVTAGAIAVEKATLDAEAGIKGSMNAINSSGKSIADSLNNVGAEVAKAADNFGNVRQRIFENLQNAMQGKPAGPISGVVGIGANLVTDITDPLRKAVKTVGNEFRDPNRPIPEKIPGREVGTMGATGGNMFENFKKSGELVELHGTEGVFKPDQLFKLMSDSASTIMKTTLQEIPDPNVANEKLIKKIFDGSMPGIKLGDFTAPSSSKPNLDTLKIPGISWGDMSKPAASTTTTTPAANAKTTTAAAPASESKKDASPAMPKQTATLDDVVKSLDQLNKQMGQLIDQQHELLTKQERAIRSNSPNVFDKVR